MYKESNEQALTSTPLTQPGGDEPVLICHNCFHGKALADVYWYHACLNFWHTKGNILQFPHVRREGCWEVGDEREGFTFLMMLLRTFWQEPPHFCSQF